MRAQVAPGDEQAAGLGVSKNLIGTANIPKFPKGSQYSLEVDIGMTQLVVPAVLYSKIAESYTQIAPPFAIKSNCTTIESYGPPAVRSMPLFRYMRLSVLAPSK
jgi:hypothetical protein